MLEELASDDLILADKGFSIPKIMPDEVSVNILTFLVGKTQFTIEEARLC